MTLGFTGVVWFPRGATLNSTALNGGVGPAPLSAASTAWSSVSVSLADATLTVTKVMADLAAGWEGVAATAALARLAPFQVWTEQASAEAATAAAKAGALAAAHTVARATMPSLVEIAAVQAAKVAAYAASGAVAGAGAAAEAAERAMDLRASLVMEAYESASTVVTAPQSFTTPPPLSNATAGAPSDTPQAPVPTNDPLTEFLVNPAQAVQNAVGAALAQPVNPQQVVSAASQAGSAVGSGLNAVAQASAAFMPTATGMVGGADATQTNPAAARASGAETRAMRAGSGGMGVPGGAGSSRVALPDGWGGGASGPGRAVPVAGPTPIVEPVRVEPAAATNRTGHVGAPMGAGGAGAADEEERRSRGYLKSFEHFEDGRVVIPSVIGGDR